MPAEAGLDPYNKLIDRVSSDNRKKVTLQWNDLRKPEKSRPRKRAACDLPRLRDQLARLPGEEASSSLPSLREAEPSVSLSRSRPALRP